MDVSRLEKLGFRLLRTRVGRRIFILFILCAVAPLAALTLLTHLRTKHEFTQHEEKKLLWECKSTALTLYSQLLSIDAQLRIVSHSMKMGALDADRPLKGSFGEELKKKVKGLALQDGESLKTLHGEMQPVEIVQDYRRILAKGSSVCLTKRNAPLPPTLSLIHSLTLANGERRDLIAEIEPSFLWNHNSIKIPDRLIAVMDGDFVPLHASSPEALTIAREIVDTPRTEVVIKDKHWLANQWNLYDPHRMLMDWHVVRFLPRDHYASVVSAFLYTLLFVSAITLAIVALLSLTQVRKILDPITQLSTAAKEVANHRYDVSLDLRTKDEFQELGDTFNRMAASIRSHMRKSEALNDVGIALSSEQDTEALLHCIVTSTRQIIICELCEVLLPDPKLETQLVRAMLESDVMCSRLQAPRSGGAERAFRRKEVQQSVELDAEGLEKRTLCLPMLNHEKDCIGVLRLSRASSLPYDEEERRLASSLASQAGVALTKNRLVDDFRALFEGVCEMIVLAIDDKSPYTGGHCRRVPIITMMIADTVQEIDSGPLGTFQLTEDELYELRIAAMLHDCGKIVTPVNIQDKATKLEQIVDRIEMISLRYEVLRREAEQRAIVIGEFSIHDPRWDHLRNGAAGPGLDIELRELQEELAFLRECNIGGEFMSPELKGRVRKIAAKHCYYDVEGTSLPMLDEEEIANLCISRGTLNDEEREIINHHVTATIRMLEHLPYPSNLKQVPLLAGAHHERMDGSGYPQGLMGYELPVQARMIALADIFEALTAKDRPYKKGKTLTEALRILGFMKKDRHIDPELFQIFIDQKIYLRYAVEHLDAEQIDAVDPEAIPGYETRGAVLV